MLRRRSLSWLFGFLIRTASLSFVDVSFETPSGRYIRWNVRSDAQRRSIIVTVRVITFVCTFHINCVYASMKIRHIHIHYQVCFYLVITYRYFSLSFLNVAKWICINNSTGCYDVNISSSALVFGLLVLPAASFANTYFLIELNLSVAFAFLT